MKNEGLDLLEAYKSKLEAVISSGYELSELPAGDGAGEDAAGLQDRIPWWPMASGIAASFVLAGLYIGIAGFVHGFEHTLGLLTGDRYFVIPNVLGFGTQVGLFVYARTKVRQRLSARSTKLLGSAIV